MTAGLAHLDIDSAPELGVRNSQPEGIGRVVALPGLVSWNNLGRNVVFADERLHPRAVFGSTSFPGEDEPSQYDLDVHAILDVPELELVVVLNHFGTVRAFRRRDLLASAGAQEVEPAAVWSFVADVERTVAVDGRLVGSRPRSEGAIGLLVSEPLGHSPDGANLAVEPGGESLGEVTALGTAPSADGPGLAVGGEGRLALVPLIDGRIGPPRWERDVDFRVASIGCQAGAVWAAGPECVGTVDDYDWDSRSGGGFALLDPADGRVRAHGKLPGGVAWGTGGVAVVAVAERLAAAGRDGSVHLFDPHHPAAHRVTAAISATSLGIAHMAALGPTVVCGFNRGGYRLHAFGQPGEGGDGGAA